MELTYNGLTNCKDIICLSGVPNLIQYTGSSTVNTKAKYHITLVSLSGVDVTKTYHITLGEYQVTSVNELDRQGGTAFWLPPVESYNNRLACTQSIARALRNVPFIAANYNVWMDDDNDGTMKPEIWIEAKKEGAAFNLDYSWDLGEVGNNTYTLATQGASDDDMLQGNDNKISVDIYRYTQMTKIGATPSQANREYLTTLEKNYSGNPVTFNVSPVLSNIVEDGEMQQYCFSIYGFSNGELRFSHITEPCYIVNGYEVNQSEPFIGTFINRFFAQNVSRGDDREQYNNTYLYVYEPTIRFSLYVKDGFSQTNVTAKFIASDGTVQTQSTFTLFNESSSSLNHFAVTLDEELFSLATFIDLVIPDVGTVRYNVIKPINAADAKDFERIYWLCEYGGVSFMDFTGQRTETRKENIEYYQKQNFDYYTADERELTKVYSKTIPITIKHKTHNIDVNGKWLLFSLQNSKNAWVEINDKIYKIHITNLEIKESSNASHIYVGEVEYQISYPDLV